MPNVDGAPSEAAARIINVDGWVTNPEFDRRLPVRITGLLRQNGTIAVEALSQNGPVESVRVTRPFYIKALPDQMMGTLPTPSPAPQARPPAAPKPTPSTAPAPKPVPTRPIKTKDFTPPYPPEAMKAKRQGVVVLELTVSREGRVSSVRVVKSAASDLDAAALAAARQWEYRPALLDGAAVEATVTENVSFLLR
jgi:TonB family protein